MAGRLSTPAPRESGSYTDGLPPARAVLGIGLMVLAVFLFASIDTVAKVLLHRGYNVLQIMWARYVFHLAVMLVAVPRIGLRPLVATRRPGLQVLRATSILIAGLAFITALEFLQLADAYALSFLSPLLVTVFAIPILGERVGWRRWSAVAVGFVGVLIVVRPGLGVTHPASGLVLIMASGFALYQVLTRRLAGGETPVSLLFYPTLVGTAVTSLLAPLVWRPVPMGDWLWLIGIGLFGAAGHGALIRGLRFAPASLLSPFIYSQMLWGLLYGWLVFGDLPDFWTLVGATVIIASGLYVLFREATRAPGPSATVVPPAAR